MSIRELRKIKLAVLGKADLPAIQAEVLLKAWLANRAVRIHGDWDPGVLDSNVLLTAQGTVNPDRTYDVEPRSAALKAWWRDTVMVESQRRGPANSLVAWWLDTISGFLFAVRTQPQVTH